MIAVYSSPLFRTTIMTMITVFQSSFQDCDHGHTPHKSSNIGHFFCKYCDQDCNPNKEDHNHDRNHIKTQKHDIFVRITIMIPVPINSTFYEDCNHYHNLQKIGLQSFCENYDHSHCPQKEDVSMRTAIIIAVFYIVIIL